MRTVFPPIEIGGCDYNALHSTSRACPAQVEFVIVTPDFNRGDREVRV
jgi:hypothetical protein